MSVSEKLVLMVVALLVFAAVIGIVLTVVAVLEKRGAHRVAWFFVGPTIVLIIIGLLYPAARTIWRSLYNAAGSAFVGVDNYSRIFTSPDMLLVLRNTGFWVVVTPFVATAVGLVYAILVDGARGEAVSKALIFLPMAISFVGAGIIWKFMYDYRFVDPSLASQPQQIGLLNQIIIWLGGTPQNFMLNQPWNTFWLILVMIWIQAGFAMTILSAAIKAIPTEITEAARLDGVNSFELFRFVTVPSIRPTLVVVLTTIAIGCLKVFDIVLTMTGGQFGTSVIANEFYQQSFTRGDQGLGAALAVLLFVLVIPIVIYNVRQLRRAEAR